MKAVHFGAGNIGRGFVGLLLHNAGYDLVFADVADALIQRLKDADSYVVHEVGENPRTHEVRGFSALNSATEAEALTAAIASADIVTTAVGAHILKFVAPAIAAGIAARPAGAAKLAVMACENAINGTDILAGEVRKAYTGADLDDRVIFANTAVDRIVPNQDPNAGLDVTVENFYEWAIETPPFGEVHPEIPGVTWVPDLEPYIERKLFTVNTGHATSAWFGYAAGIEKISDALADPGVAAKVAAVLVETASLIVAKHGVLGGDPGRLRREDPEALRQPLPARHHPAGRAGAAAQAQPQRAVRQPRVPAGRARHGPRCAAGGDGRWPALRRCRRPRGGRAAAVAGHGFRSRGRREGHRARARITRCTQTSSRLSRPVRRTERTGRIARAETPEIEAATGRILDAADRARRDPAG